MFYELYVPAEDRTKLATEVGVEPTVEQRVRDRGAHRHQVTHGEHQVDGLGGGERVGVELHDDCEGSHGQPR